MSSESQTYSAWSISDYNTPMVLLQYPFIDLKPTEVRIKIYAASINPIDFKTIAGALKIMKDPPKPLRIGYDIAGVIVSIGKEVTTFNVGDEIYGRPMSEGALGEYMNVEYTQICKKPNNMTFEQAAAVPLACLTAYQAFKKYEVNDSKRVFINGGAGGVGTYAIQLAKIFKAQDIASTSSAPKHALLKTLGAQHTIDYKTQNFTEILKDYDFVFDATGNVKDCFKVLKSGGKTISIASTPTGSSTREFVASTGAVPFYLPTVLDLLNTSNYISAYWAGVYYDFFWLDASVAGKDLDVIKGYIEAGSLVSVIDSTFEYKDAQAAMDKLKTGTATGKIVIKIV